jgi:hypothetical protein
MNWTILVGAVFIAAAIALAGRFEIIQGGGEEFKSLHVWKIDRWTGAIWLCAYNSTGSNIYCDPYEGRTSHAKMN